MTSPSSSPSARPSSPTTRRTAQRREQAFHLRPVGSDFWTLIQAGYAPLGMVMGSCVYHIAHREPEGNGQCGRNVEIPKFTEALYDARELAMSRMRQRQSN